MYRLIKDDVNKKHSYTWTKLNDDARYELFRKEFIAEFGGEFDTKGVWTEKKVEVERTFLI